MKISKNISKKNLKEQLSVNFINFDDKHKKMEEQEKKDDQNKQDVEVKRIFDIYKNYD